MSHLFSLAHSRLSRSRASSCPASCLVCHPPCGGGAGCSCTPPDGGGAQWFLPLLTAATVTQLQLRPPRPRPGRPQGDLARPHRTVTSDLVMFEMRVTGLTL